jgi:hypothetical protein
VPARIMLEACGGMSEWSCRANRTQSGLRAVGGKLTLAAGRLEFRPHGFDSSLGGQTWGADLADIHAVDKEARSWNPFDGGMRTRLRVETADGSELFLVNRLDSVIERIRAAAGLARPPA